MSAGRKDDLSNSIEISVRGKWILVPALEFEGKMIVMRGTWIKLAVVHDEELLDSELGNPEACAERLRQLRSTPGLRTDIFTFTQKLPDTTPRYDYPLELDSVAAVRTSSFKDWWEKLPQESRKNVRRSQKRGVTISIREFGDDLILGIVGINNDAPMKQGRPNDHYGKSLEQVRKDQESFQGRSDFICAHVGEEMIGYLKIIYRGQVAAILNLTCKASHFDKRPSNALLTKAIEICEQKGITHLTYGKFNYGNKRDHSLREFKTRNGFEEILVPRFYIPLTPWGRACTRLKLYRGLVGILPERIIALAVDARTKWYNLRSVSKPV
jgi:hypothetical protein